MCCALTEPVVPILNVAGHMLVSHSEVTFRNPLMFEVPPRAVLTFIGSCAGVHMNYLAGDMWLCCMLANSISGIILSLQVQTSCHAASHCLRALFGAGPRVILLSLFLNDTSAR